MAMLSPWTISGGNIAINGVRGEEERYRQCKEICENSGEN